MTEARIAYDWTHTSNLLAMLANCHRDPKSKPYFASHFNPTSKKPKRQVVPVTFLRDVFCK